MKFYYDCQIKAAYMSRYFNVAYKEYDYIFGGGAGVMLPIPNKFYVHPNSFPIFQPRGGDIVIFNDAVCAVANYPPPVNYTLSRQFQINSGYPDSKSHEVIYRDGRVFIYPEIEENE